MFDTSVCIIHFIKLSKTSKEEKEYNGNDVKFLKI